MNLENGMMYVSKLSSLQLDSFMRVSSGTVQALQIFQEDYHPNVIKGIVCVLLLLILLSSLHPPCRAGQKQGGFLSVHNAG